MFATRSLPAAALAATALLAPTAAHAATDFVAVTPHGDVGRLTSQTGGAFDSLTISHDGVPNGATVVALDKAPDGRLLALDSTGRVSQLNAAHAAYTPLFAGNVVIPGGVPTGQATTFSIAADGASATVVTAEQAYTVDLASGVATAAGSPTGADDVALDRAADGRWLGLDGASGNGIAQASVGAPPTLLAKSPAPSGGATSATVSPDGSAWGLRGLAFKGRTDRQSMLLKIDPAAGKVSYVGQFFQRPLTAIAATGTSPDVTAAPKARITIAKRQSLRDIRRHGGIRVTFTSDQPGQRIASAKRGELNVGTNSDLGELPSPTAKSLRLRASKTALKRITVGSHITVNVSVHGKNPKATTRKTRTVTITR